MFLLNRKLFEIETCTLPIKEYLFSFIAILLLRHFLEAFSQQWNYFNLPSQPFFIDFIHVSLFYITLATLLISFFRLTTRLPTHHIIKCILSGFIIILFAPILDLIFTTGHGINITYIHPGKPINFLYTYLSIGGGYQGISLGMRMEVMLVMCGCFYYFFMKQNSVWSAFCYAIGTYTCIFLLGSSPYILQWLMTSFGYIFIYSSELMIGFYLGVLMILIASQIWVFLLKR